MRSIRKNARRAAVIGAAALVASAGLAAPAHAAPFGSGNLVVYRVGTGGVDALTNAATPVLLDEFTTTGGPALQSIAVPPTASGTATSEGLISRSSDGCSVVFTGYDAAAGTPTVVSTPSSTVKRVVGKVDGSGSIATSTALTAYSANNIRSATSDAGTQFWSGGVGSASDGGINYLSSLAASGLQLNNTATNLRQVHVFGGQLYTSAGSGATRIATVGTGLPTTAPQTITNLPGAGISGLGSPYGFLLLDRDAATAGLDTLYVADDTGAGVLLKFELSGGNWVARGTFVMTDPRGLTGRIVGNGVELFVTEDATNDILVKVVDSSAFGANISATRTNLATAAANTAFRGVAFTPDVCGPGPVIPEASMVVLLPLGALAVMGASYVVLRPRKVLA